MPYLAAKYVHQKILEIIPNTEDWDSYRSSLEVVKVTGLGEGLTAHALRSAPRSRKVKTSDVNRTLLYIQPKRRLRRVKPEIKILEKYSPWTIPTIPFLPSHSQAVIVSRKVSKFQIGKVSKARKKDQTEWKKELVKVGRAGLGGASKVDLSSRVTAVPDVSYDGVRLEFGYRGSHAIPHWRPSIRSLISSGIRTLFRTDRRIVQALTDLKFKTWKRWPPSVSQTIGPAEAKKYVPFQKKLGIRAKL